MNLLIIEDDTNLNEGLFYAFESEGFNVLKAYTKQEGLHIFNNKNIDFIILDCNLPDGNGFDICKQIREMSDIPIIMLTARDSEIDEVTGLEIGLDDYITKPFSLSVLKARVKVAIRKKSNNKVLYSNGIRLDQKLLKVYKNEVDLELSAVEYKLINYLIENKGQILLKEQILHHIWDSEENYVDENIISVNIRRLRMKVEDNPSNPKYIKTAYGMGYLWNEVE
ncbi:MULTISPECIES: response regulator transcription factor [unclassified Clostridioides]|uniref:response regulator transcription factor n=1 Tax=unclassified Clostridioides TaxID=2635829 RepID=UPI001D0C86DD|nr:response regulator transcription factor [Clostridioides sp. ES-S-0001-02]MCC0638612.1 response regulator transcription factor [Clostridioides sp. ES-S-0049-03]MCC0652549.1 response regulator transcription factor [Clostridioides sp. ES-S-0001-03]MCC0655225.1 response regulator transcription factor [Clostridioides sp. ES-S-0123-01]MCC0672977.1 response regulator transcription factor [Clostridioides sp. ES-S-0145-01]MCC0675000.1 response regulator transcription factor [Clostridioides sp. ES-W-